MSWENSCKNARLTSPLKWFIKLRDCNVSKTNKEKNMLSHTDNRVFIEQMLRLKFAQRYLNSYRSHSLGFQSKQSQDKLSRSKNVAPPFVLFHPKTRKI